MEKDFFGYFIIVIVGVIIIGIIGGFMASIWLLFLNWNYGSHIGTVIDKQYSAESSYITTRTQSIGNSSYTVPEYHYSPERFNIKIQKDENGKTKTTWIEVTKEEYDSLKIGDYYGE